MGESPGVLVVCLVGRLHPVKGHFDLLEAATELIQELPDLRLAFMGAEDHAVPGHAEFLQERAAANGLGDSVCFSGTGTISFG